MGDFDNRAKSIAEDIVDRFLLSADKDWGKRSKSAAVEADLLKVVHRYFKNHLPDPNGIASYNVNIINGELEKAYQENKEVLFLKEQVNGFFKRGHFLTPEIKANIIETPSIRADIYKVVSKCIETPAFSQPCIKYKYSRPYKNHFSYYIYDALLERAYKSNKDFKKLNRKIQKIAKRAADKYLGENEHKISSRGIKECLKLLALDYVKLTSAGVKLQDEMGIVEISAIKEKFDKLYQRTEKFDGTHYISAAEALNKSDSRQAMRAIKIIGSVFFGGLSLVGMVVNPAIGLGALGFGGYGFMQYKKMKNLDCYIEADDVKEMIDKDGIWKCDEQLQYEKVRKWEKEHGEPHPNRAWFFDNEKDLAKYEELYPRADLKEKMVENKSAARGMLSKIRKLPNSGKKFIESMQDLIE